MMQNIENKQEKAIVPQNNKIQSEMKKYIGTKQIEAEPMTMGEAYEKNLLQAGRVPNESEKTKAGYHVKYEGGYESWSPAEPFEKAYKVADTPLDRMIIEYDELKQKIDKLDVFLDSEKFKTLDEKVKGLLSSQYHIMIAYSIVLSERMRLM